MKIVVDTTVFGQGFNSRSADVELLKAFLGRTQSELCVPEIVYDEAVNLARKSLEDVNAKLDAVQRLTSDPTKYSKFDIKAEIAVHRDSLDKLLGSLNARILPYPEVKHKMLAARALIPSKPFVSGGRGYRDCLVWFSLLELAGQCSGHISFISANTSDWCENKSDLRLHVDYVADMRDSSIDVSRIRIYSSLGHFNQECSIASLPESPKAPAKPRDQVPNYERILLERKAWVETLFGRSLPLFLRDVSRVNAEVEDVELVALGSPSEIRALPTRTLDPDRRLFQFSAQYKLAVEFSIQRSYLAAWSQRLSFHQRRDLSESKTRLMATVPVRVSFHAVERAEEIEGLSILTMVMAGEYRNSFTGPDPVAVKFHQIEINAPEHNTQGTVTCDSCHEQFVIGNHRLFPSAQTPEEFVAKLESLLADDHKANRPHANLYNLEGPYRID